jgi:hypothetical protein
MPFALGHTAMPARILPKLTRRELLQVSAAAGVAWSLPWLSGCGSNDGSADSAAPGDARETRALQLDLSAHDPDAEYRIHAIGSQRNLAILSVHDAESRRHLRATSARFANVPDAALTHYLDAIDLPASRVQHIWVTREDGTSDSTLVLSTIYVPQRFQLQVQQLRDTATADLEDDNLRITARDAAIAVVYHHPQIIRLDAMQAAIVRDLIESSELIDLLADHIYSLGDGWITKVPVVDTDGSPLLDKQGRQYIQQDPSEATMEVADQVIADVLNLVGNEQELEGANWHLHTGRTTEAQPSLAGADPAEVLDTVDTGEFIVKARYGPGCVLNGVVLDDLSVEQAHRTVKLSVKNTWLRFVGVYAEFFNAANQRVFPYNDSSKSDKTALWLLDIPVNGPSIATTARCINVAATNTDYLGIPFRERDIVPTLLNVRFPETASRARLVFGTLGMGGDAFTAMGEVGSSVTLVVNIGIPAFMLAATVGSDTVSDFATVFKDPGTLAKLLTLLPLSIYQSTTLKDVRPVLYTFGKILVGLCLRGLPLLAATIAEKVGLAAFEEAIPIAGWVVKAARVAAAASEIGQTVSEVTSGPALFENMIELAMNTTVTIHHDPNNFQFPATATHYVLKATYDKSTSLEITGQLPTTRSEPIVELFREVPAGGMASIEVWFLSANNWIAGHGTTGTYKNTPEEASEKMITITENLVPLNEKTHYSHKEKLALQNGRYVWAAAPAPRQTRYALDCDDASLCSLDSITVGQSAAMAGYAWRARSTVDLCGDGPATAPVHRIQNISIAQTPDSGLKSGGCGYTAKPLLAYKLLAAGGATRPESFYLDPSNNGFHLRAVALDGTAPFDQMTRLSWGEFSQLIDSMVVHPAGFVVGVNTQQHRLEIITLREQPLPDEQAVFATLKAGRGKRVGLLDTPIAVGVDAMSHAILVLEAGNRRIQAFDCYGNQLLHFNKQKSATMPLRDEGAAPVQYLDMAVESTGYIYVLSFRDDGIAAADYHVDIYNPNGDWLSQTSGVTAARLAVDKWRNLFTLNYEALAGPHGPEPSISEWIPSTPDACSPAGNPFCERPDV